MQPDELKLQQVWSCFNFSFSFD